MDARLDSPGGSTSVGRASFWSRASGKNWVIMPEKMAGANCFKYNFALVSRIANSFAETSSFDLKPGVSPINIEKARAEHEQLVDALRRISLDVIELPCDEKHPDGLFVDDIAVVINGTALICRPQSPPNKPSREGEVSWADDLFVVCYFLTAVDTSAEY